LVLIVAKWAMESWLRRLNRRYVLAHASAVPEAFKDTIDPATYAKSVQYTLAKSQLSQVEDSYAAVLLLAVLFSGVLPWTFYTLTGWLGHSAWVLAGCLFVIGVALGTAELPLDWYAQFRLEERFGFNTTTPRLSWLDRLKQLLLGIVLGYPLLVLVLKLVEWTGQKLWLWAWASVLGFELLMVVLAPVLILPLFNKVHSVAGGNPARATLVPGPPNWLSDQRPSGDGRQQTFSAFECLLHWLRAFSKNRFV